MTRNARNGLRRAALLAGVVALVVVGAVADSADSARLPEGRLVPAASDFTALLEHDAEQPTSAPAPDIAAVHAAIEHENAMLLAAFGRGDSAELAGRSSEGASFEPADKVTAHGRGRIAAWFDAQREAGLGGLTLHTVNVVRVGELTYETGTWGSRGGRPANPDPAYFSDSGRYYAIWKSGPDGNWGCQAGIWNSNGDPRGAAVTSR